MWSRRQFIKTGLVGGGVLLAARALYGPFAPDPVVSDDPDFVHQILGAKERTILSAVAPVILAGAMPREATSPGLMTSVIRGVDTAVSSLPPPVQEEVRDLFALLDFPVTRRIVAGLGKPWLEAGPQDVEDFLERWKGSRFALLRSAYRALQELIVAAWYANPESWARIGYPGPPAVPLSPGLLR
jgi:hypothetical protein